MKTLKQIYEEVGEQLLSGIEPNWEECWYDAVDISGAMSSMITDW